MKSRKPLNLTRRMILCGAALVAGGLLAGCNIVGSVIGNQLELTEFSVDGQKLLMSGLINSKTLDQFETVFAANPDITTVVEGEIDGSIDDDTMIALAYRVRALGLNTHLTADSKIYSGGVDLYLAGVQRTMERGAVIGVHSWSDGIWDAADYPRDAPEHEQNRLYIERMLGDDAFYWFTIYAAPADGIHEMTDQEIARFNLLTQPIR